MKGKCAMNQLYNKHYIIIDSQNRTTGGWSDGPKPNRNTNDAICINEQEATSSGCSLVARKIRPCILWTVSRCTAGTARRLWSGLSRKSKRTVRLYRPRHPLLRNNCGQTWTFLRLCRGEFVSVFKLAQKYYPRLWDRSRLEALVKARRMTSEEMNAVINNEIGFTSLQTDK